MKIENVIFDFGGVLVDWNPRHMYKDYFQSESEMEHFLHHVCTEAWNLEQDRGRSLAEGTLILQQQFPEFHDMIQLFYDKWEIMLKSDIPGTVALMYQLKAKYPLYGLTNWSAETIEIAYGRYEFFKAFDGIVVSGIEKMIKPDKQFYHVLLERYDINPAFTLFIDDNIHNIKAAKEIGLHAIHFENPGQLETALLEINAL